jgi:phosphoglycolate phosphatase-like HAD superfamily hydrolase
LTASGATDTVESMGTRIFDFRFGLVDLDGVVFNPGILYRREFGRFLERGYRISAKEALRFYQAHEALPLEAKLARLLAEHGHPAEEGAAAATAFRTAVTACRPVVSEGAREILEALARREAVLFALSETETAAAEERLVATELTGLFRQVIGIDQAPRGRGQIAHCAAAVHLPLHAFASQSVALLRDPEEVALAAELGCYSIGVAHCFPEEVLKAHGAQEVYRHVAHLALLLRAR